MNLIFSNNVMQDEGDVVTALDKSALPVLGVGLSFRNEIAHELYAHLDKIDFMEIIVDAAFSGVLDENFYDQVVSRVPVIAHGIDASLGSLELPHVGADYSQRVAAEVQRLQSPWYSEHLAFTRAGGIDAGQLLPVQRTRQMIDFLTPKLRAFGRVLQVPLLIENIAYYFDLPGAEMDEAEFLVEIARRTGCGLLLDLNNLHANCLNHKLDAFAYLDAIPAELVVEVHVAGGEFQEGIYIDTHGHPVNRQVCDLLEYVCRFKRPNSVVLEREKNLPPIDVLIDELAMLKELWAHSL